MIHALLAALVASFQAGPAAQGSLLRGAPTNTVAALVGDDLPGLRRGLQASPLRALWDDEDLRPLRDLLVEQVLRTEHVEGLTLEDVLRVPVRSAALFVVLGETDEQSALLLALRIGERDSPEFSALADLLTAVSTPVDLDGYAASLRRLEDDGSVLLCGDWSEGLLLGWGPDEAWLTSSAREAFAALEGEPTAAGTRLTEQSDVQDQIALHLDLGALARRDAVEQDTSLAGLHLEELGLASARLRIADSGEMSLEYRLQLPEHGPLNGFLTTLGSAPAHLAEVAPEEVTTVDIGHLDVAGVLDLVLDALDSEISEGFEAGLAAFSDTLGIDLRTAGLDNLTGDFAFLTFAEREPPQDDLEGAFQWARAMLTTTVQHPNAVIVIGLDDGAAAGELIQATLRTWGLEALLSAETIDGVVVATLELPGQASAESVPCWYLLQNALLFGYRPELVARVAARLDDLEAPGWLDLGDRRESLASWAASSTWTTRSDLGELSRGWARKLGRGLYELSSSPAMLPLGRVLLDQEGLLLEGCEAVGRSRLLRVQASLLLRADRALQRHVRGELFSSLRVEERTLAWSVWTAGTR